MIFGKEKEDPLLTLEKDKTEIQRHQGNMAIGDSEEIMQFEKPERQDFLRWQQELGDELERLKHDLRNEEFNGESWVKLGNPIVNEKGIHMIERLIRPLLSRNLINSNIDEEMVYGILRRTSDTLVNNITYYGEEYNIEFGNWDYVLRLVKNVIIPTPFRAQLGWTKKTDSTMSKRLESFAESQQSKEKSQGLFGNVFNKG